MRKYKCPDCGEIFDENEVHLVPDVYEEDFMDDHLVDGCPYCSSPLDIGDFIENDDDDDDFEYDDDDD